MFTVVEHVIPCQFVREYPRATANGQNTGLSLAIKQYTPTKIPDASFPRITIIGAHGNGFPKELYEPLWEELHDALVDNGIAIQSIWIADAAHQGRSGVLNEEILGNDPSLFDHSRDLICMINHFRSQMTLPIIGVGHSMGAAQLIHAALSHARLFCAQILIEPVLYDMPPNPAWKGPAHGAAARRDRWVSRDALASYVAKNKLYQFWDPRCLQLWTKYGVRDDTTGEGAGGVTLTTTKDQETFALTRPTYLSSTPSSVSAGEAKEHNHAKLDATLTEHPEWPFLQAEPIIIFHNLPFYRPSALYMYGAQSDFLKAAGMRKRAVESTGVSVLGSGGRGKGRVEQESIENAGHMAPVEQPGIIARKSAGWIAREVQRWQEETAAVEGEWRGKVGKEKRLLDEEFLVRLGPKEGKSKI